MMKADMNLQLGVSKLKRVRDIEIPEIFFRRFKTNKEALDHAFGGEGFLPGMVFTLAGSPGAGKTTLLLQTLELLEASKVNTAYMSGEENVYQLAFAARRLHIKNTRICNMSVIEDIFEVIKEEKIQMLILDSFPCLVTRTGLQGVAKEKYIANYIVKMAKELEVVVGVVLHFTKQGDYKGSTLLPHAADASLILTVNKEDDSLRDLDVTKNRFGRTGVSTFSMSDSGFDFSEVRHTEVDGAPLQKKSKTEVAKSKILNFLSTKSKIGVSEMATLLGDAGIVQRITKDLVNAGILIKSGRGANAVWQKNV